MENTNLFLISILHLLFGGTVLIVTINGIVKCNKISVFDCIKLMYAMIYGFLQGLIYYYESLGERNLYYYDYSGQGIFNLYILLLFAVLIYLELILWHKCFVRNNETIKPNELQLNKLVYIEKYGSAEDIYHIGIIMLAFGFLCIFLWTRAYGTIQNFILNADAIRSSRSTVHNRFAFLQHFASIVLVSFYALFASFLSYKPSGLRKIVWLIMLGLSAICVYIYLLCTDSRVTIAYIGIAICLLMIKNRKSNNIKRTLGIAGILICVVLLLTMTADTVTHFVRYGEWKSGSFDLAHSLITEFRFTVSSEMMAMNQWWKGTLHIKFFDDLLNALISWFPESWTPFVRPESVWTYNTMNISGTIKFGQSPSDIVGTSIYEFGVIGVVLYPFIFSVLLSTVENALNKTNKTVYSDVLYAAFAVRLINLTSHNQLSSFALGCFSIFLYYLIAKVYLGLTLRRRMRQCNFDMKGRE